VIKAQHVSATNIYIQSATLNGKPHRRSYLTHGDLMRGGQLVFKLGPRPNRLWGSAANEVPTSQIVGDKIIPAPAINAAGRTFKDRLEISLQALETSEQVQYTTDGSDPDRAAPVFTKPFSIDRTSTIRAIAITRDGQRSVVATAKFQKIPHDWQLTLLSRYGSQYTGGGDFALIDGARGSKNFTDGAWQGYQGKDLVAIIDLGRQQNVSKLGAGFLQDVGSWIWMPRQIEFELSNDGKNFVPALTLTSDVSEKEYGGIAKDFIGTITPQQARYVKMIARTYGKLPAWHLGAGGDSWIFADEIIIE
jgi:hypothetical protein